MLIFNSFNIEVKASITDSFRTKVIRLIPNRFKEYFVVKYQLRHEISNRSKLSLEPLIDSFNHWKAKKLSKRLPEFAGTYFMNNEGHRPNYRNDPTVDGYIKEHGAIKSHLDNKYYTTKRSYMDSLKAAGKSIDDS